MLEQHPALHVWGYSARHDKDDPIAAALLALVKKEPPMKMKVFKYCCALMALSYLTGAVLPMAQYAGAVQTAPEWVGRTALAVACLLLGTITFGIQSRKPIYWKLVSILMATYLLLNFVVPLLDAIKLSLPWYPFVFVIVLAVIGFLVFMAWWRNQKSYFAPHSRG